MSSRDRALTRLGGPAKHHADTLLSSMCSVSPALTIENTGPSGNPGRCSQMRKSFAVSGRRGRTRTRNLRFWRPLLYPLSYTPRWVQKGQGPSPAALRSRTRTLIALFRLSVRRVLVAARTVLLQLKPSLIVAPVLLCGVIALFALRTRQSDNNTNGLFCHSSLSAQANSLANACPLS